MNCPLCGSQMIIHMDTPLCPSCNDIQIQDLTWDRNFIKMKEEKNE